MMYHKEYKNHIFFIGILKKFQWLGFMILTDNTIIYNKELVIEFRFFWLKIWYVYSFNKKTTHFNPKHLLKSNINKKKYGKYWDI